MTTTKPAESAKPEELKTTNEILHFLQANLKAPKDQKPQNGRFVYRSCEGILEALKPHLPDGCAVTLTDEIAHIGDRFYVKATAILTTPYGEVGAAAFAREHAEEKGMNPPQITGSSSSYARKYALNGLFAIDDAKDPDDDRNRIDDQKAPQQQRKPSTPDPIRKDVIDKMLADLTAAANITQLNEAWAKISTWRDNNTPGTPEQIERLEGVKKARQGQLELEDEIPF